MSVNFSAQRSDTISFPFDHVHSYNRSGWDRLNIKKGPKHHGRGKKVIDGELAGRLLGSSLFDTPHLYR